MAQPRRPDGLLRARHDYARFYFMTEEDAAAFRQMWLNEV